MKLPEIENNGYRKVIRPAVDTKTPAVPPRAPRLEYLPMQYAFWDIPVGGSGVFPRAKGTVQNALYAYLKTLPEGHGRKFVVRKIQKQKTRVWRMA